MIAFLKKFVNSTIGTSSVLPLDQLIAAGVPVVKSVQRGTYSGAGGTVTINAVNMNKAVVHSVSKGSAGTVQATGRILVNTSGNMSPYSGGSNTAYLTLQDGATDLTVKLYSAVLTNATTLTCDGPVQWQVIEYY